MQFIRHNMEALCCFGLDLGFLMKENVLFSRETVFNLSPELSSILTLTELGLHQHIYSLSCITASLFPLICNMKI